MQPRLVAISGPLKGTTIPIPVEELLIGREPANNMMINDPLVSRRHCSIGKLEGRVRITDLESPYPPLAPISMTGIRDGFRHGSPVNQPPFSASFVEKVRRGEKISRGKNSENNFYISY